MNFSFSVCSSVCNILLSSIILLNLSACEYGMAFCGVDVHLCNVDRPIGFCVLA